MKLVATNTADQLYLQALHRVRERPVSHLTCIINQIRAFLLKCALPSGKDRASFQANSLAAPSDALSFRSMLAGARVRLSELTASFKEAAHRHWKRSGYRYWPAPARWHGHRPETDRAWPGSSP